MTDEPDSGSDSTQSKNPSSSVLADFAPSRSTAREDANSVASSAAEDANATETANGSSGSPSEQPDNADRSEATQRNGSDEELFAVEYRPERIPLHTNKKPMTNQKTLDLQEEIDDDELRSTRGTQRYCSECQEWVKGNQRLDHPDHHHLGRTVAEANQRRSDDPATTYSRASTTPTEEDDAEIVGNEYTVTVSYTADYVRTVGAVDKTRAEEVARDEINLSEATPDDMMQVHTDVSTGKTIFEDDDEAEEWNLTY